jgi:hypothetical protein
MMSLKALGPGFGGVDKLTGVFPLLGVVGGTVGLLSCAKVCMESIKNAADNMPLLKVCIISL